MWLELSHRYRLLAVFRPLIFNVGIFWRNKIDFQSTWQQYGNLRYLPSFPAWVRLRFLPWFGSRWSSSFQTRIEIFPERQDPLESTINFTFQLINKINYSYLKLLLSKTFTCFGIFRLCLVNIVYITKSVIQTYMSWKNLEKILKKYSKFKKSVKLSGNISAI